MRRKAKAKKRARAQRQAVEEARRQRAREAEIQAVEEARRRSARTAAARAAHSAHNHPAIRAHDALVLPTILRLRNDGLSWPRIAQELDGAVRSARPARPLPAGQVEGHRGVEDRAATSRGDARRGERRRREAGYADTEPPGRGPIAVSVTLSSSYGIHVYQRRRADS